MKTSFALILLTLGASVARADDAFTVEVKKGACREQVRVQGELRAASTINIHAPEMEEHYLTVKSAAENGASVKQGDAVLEFEDGLYQLALKAASQEVDLRQAQRDLTRFQLEDERIKNDMEIKRREIALAKAQTEVVRDSLIISPVELKKAELSVALAALELNQAKATRAEFETKYAVGLKVKELEVQEAQRKVEQAKDALAKSVVRAPRDGVIFKPFVRLNNEKGRVERNKVVRPGDKLLELPSFDAFEGVCYLPGADVRFVKPGDAVTVHLTVDPAAAIKGRVLRKDPYPMTRNERLGRDDAEGHLKEFEVVLALDAKDAALRPGLTFTATIDVTLADDALYVPQAAVHMTGQSAFVYTKAPGGPAKVPVTLGASGYAHAVIQSGLIAGQPVLLGVED